jgi:hypothetical protein
MQETLFSTEFTGTLTFDEAPRSFGRKEEQHHVCLQAR